VTSLSESSQGDNREKWGDFWEKLIVINQTKSGRDVWFPLQIYIISVSMILFATIYSTFFP
jgi:hypothetical protein